MSVPTILALADGTLLNAGDLWTRAEKMTWDTRIGAHVSRTGMHGMWAPVGKDEVIVWLSAEHVTHHSVIINKVGVVTGMSWTNNNNQQDWDVFIGRLQRLPPHAHFPSYDVGDVVIVTAGPFLGDVAPIKEKAHVGGGSPASYALGFRWSSMTRTPISSPTLTVGPALAKLIGPGPLGWLQLVSDEQRWPPGSTVRVNGEPFIVIRWGNHRLGQMAELLDPADFRLHTIRRQDFDADTPDPLADITPKPSALTESSQG